MITNNLEKQQFFKTFEKDLESFFADKILLLVENFYKNNVNSECIKSQLADDINYMMSRFKFVETLPQHIYF